MKENNDKAAVEKAFEHWYCTYENTWSKPPTFRMIADWFFANSNIKEAYPDKLTENKIIACDKCNSFLFDKEVCLSCGKIITKQ